MVSDSFKIPRESAKISKFKIFDLKISKPLLDQSFGEKSDLGPKKVIFRLKWKLSPFNYPEFIKNVIFLFPFKFNFAALKEPP